jgi:serine protease Do
MKTGSWITIFFGLMVFSVSYKYPAAAVERQFLPDTIIKIKPAIVAVGTYQKIRRPPANFSGTGFVIANGLHVVTNAHVAHPKVEAERGEFIAVFSEKGELADVREATRIAVDLDHDLVVLKISGPPLPNLILGDSRKVREGESYAFTGFPIGMALGLQPVTHKAIIPIAIPQQSAQQLDKKILTRLSAPHEVFQLDATAYPGNSGSPLYDLKTGHVVGILNKVFVQESKEHLLEKPSGITYAIPINFLRVLLRKLGIEH